MNTDKIVFATNNTHKLTEVRSILFPHYQVVSLSELGFFDDIPETATTLAGNASIKSHHIYEKFGVDCFSDDTGLEIESLNGEPGVYSARYAGKDCLAENNMKKVLSLLGDNPNRKASFRTVVSLIQQGKEFFFEGIIRGEIAFTPSGTNGFGYDPIFIPEGFTKTFAELPSIQKNMISHRALAIKALTKYLLNQ